MSPMSAHVDDPKAHHSSLLRLFHRRKRQTSAPIAPRPPAPKLPTSPFSFAQRIRLHRDRPRVDRPIKTSQSQTIHGPKTKRAAKSTTNDALTRSKALSADNIRDLDPDFLTDALLALAEQPMVARSTPKHAVICENPRTIQDRRLRNCIFEPEVYDKMLSDSVLVLDLLTNSLDELAVEVRTQSPQVGRKPTGTRATIPG